MNNNNICKINCFNKKKVKKIKTSLPTNEKIHEIAEMINNFSDSTRIKIILSLAEEELCVCDVSHIIDLSLSATSHQLRKLRDKNILKSRNDGKMVYYSLKNKKFLQFIKNSEKILDFNNKI